MGPSWGLETILNQREYRKFRRRLKDNCGLISYITLSVVWCYLQTIVLRIGHQKRQNRGLASHVAPMSRSAMMGNLAKRGRDSRRTLGIDGAP